MSIRDELAEKRARLVAASELERLRMAGENGEGYLNLKVEPTTYLLAVNTTGTGNGTVSGAGDYEAGATVTDARGS